MLKDGNEIHCQCCTHNCKNDSIFQARVDFHDFRLYIWMPIRKRCQGTIEHICNIPTVPRRNEIITISWMHIWKGVTHKLRERRGWGDWMLGLSWWWNKAWWPTNYRNECFRYLDRGRVTMDLTRWEDNVRKVYKIISRMQVWSCRTHTG
jgi:hypothetical protein